MDLFLTSWLNMLINNHYIIHYQIVRLPDNFFWCCIKY